MSDLISRESVIKELNELRRYVPFPSSKDVFDIIMKAKAIEQGEAVAWMLPNNEGNDSFFRDNASKVMCKGNDWSNWIPLYLSPQQSQSVDDALEEALTIALEYTQYSYERRQITNRIRALIKPNLVKECDDKEYDDEREEIASEHLDDVIAWLKYRGLYDEIDYLNEVPDFSEILTNHEHELIQQSASSQQTQEQGELFRKAVADALEEAAKNILERKQTPLYPNEFDGGLMCYNEGLDVAVQIIRALIKRNTEGVE
ncbi:MAG: hypothetical protein CTY32_08345 [Methylotenera sp.]|nr:MAG: hypothetical protein CTY32_08345 [Methylotenera sp.]